MAKKQSSDKYKIYAFMTNPHQLLIVYQDIIRQIKGVRRYVRPDTGEVALTEQIPYEERQLNMKLDGPAGETTAEALASDQDAEKKRDAQDVKGEQAAGNNAEPAPESDDFPPPDETVEQPQAV